MIQRVPVPRILTLGIKWLHRAAHPMPEIGRRAHMTPAQIPLVVTLKKSSRTPEILAQVQQIAARLGLEPSGVGAAALSYRVLPSVFARLFGRQAKALSARAPQESDYGAPSGYEGRTYPPRPSSLLSWTRSLSCRRPLGTASQETPSVHDCLDDFVSLCFENASRVGTRPQGMGSIL
jgi:hypothetical protein